MNLRKGLKQRCTTKETRGKKKKGVKKVAPTGSQKPKKGRGRFRGEPPPKPVMTEASLEKRKGQSLGGEKRDVIQQILHKEEKRVEEVIKSIIKGGG